jgi:hypothetical protein
MSATSALDEMLALLDRERAALTQAVDAIPGADRDRRPSAEVWSVAEVLEHLMRVERGVGKLFELRGHEQPAADAPPAVPLDAARVNLLRNRLERMAVPDRVRPTGTVESGAALQALTDARAALRTALVHADPDSLERCTHPHPLLGNISLRDWAHFVAHHEARHVSQIAEIAAALSTRTE